jgi:ketosteroid isomerase-like protein
MTGFPDPRARVETALEIWNREGLEALTTSLWHPDIVWEEPHDFPEASVHHGREACVARMAERFTVLGEVALELIDAEDVGSGRILAEVKVHGQGTTSGVTTEAREFFLFDYKDDLTIRFREFMRREEAWAAVRADAQAQADDPA